MHLFTSSKGWAALLLPSLFISLSAFGQTTTLTVNKVKAGAVIFTVVPIRDSGELDLENSYTIAEDDPSVSSGKRTLSIEASTPGVYHIIQENASKYVVTAFTVADPSQDRYKRVRTMRDGYTLIYPDGNTDFTTWEEVEAEEGIQE